MEVLAAVPNTGRECTVVIHEHSTALDVKKQVADELELDVDRLRLMFNDIDLDKLDDSCEGRVSCVGITQDDVIKVEYDKWGAVREEAKAKLSEAEIELTPCSLVRAIERNDKRTVENLLAAGVGINAPDMIGDTSIHAAARSGNTELMGYLLESDGLLNVKSNSGATPLHRATCHPNMVTFLLEAGAQHSPVNKHGNTPLLDAIYNGNIYCVELLMKAGANVTISNQRGENGLFFAKDMEMVRFLLAAGCDVNQRDIDGGTVLHAAVSIAPEDVWEEYIRASSGLTKVVDSNGNTPLNILAQMWDKASSYRSVSKDALNIPNKKGWAPIFYPASMGNITGLKRLLSLGADPTLADADGNTPLHIALLTGKQHIVDRCLTCMKVHTVKNNKGKTPAGLAKSLELALPEKYRMKRWFSCAVM